jgi:hypothetical protein
MQISSPNFKYMKMNISILKHALVISGLLQVPQVPSFANEKNVAVHAEIQPVATIKYLGIQDEFYLFQVDYRQPSESRATLRITDGNGTELFRTVFSEKVFTRKIKIAREGYKNLQFVFDGNKQLVTKTYAINIEMVEKIVVEEMVKL